MGKKEYITIGIKTITKELFRNVLRPLDNQTFRPDGGLWASDYRPYTISPWLQYLINNQEYYSHKDINNATIFELKKEANILTINDHVTLKNIIEKYPSYHHSLNYLYGDKSSINFELLSRDYDGLYLNYINLYIYDMTRIFRGWNVNTLLLFNLDMIDNCKSVKIDFYSSNTLEYPYIKETNKYLISEESTYHKRLLIFIKELFNKLVSEKRIFNDYDEYFTYLIECTNRCIKITMENKEKEANEIRKILKENDIQVSNYIIIRNIVADTLSNYLRDNVQIEQNLPKTKIKKTREYPIEEQKK